MFTFNYLFTKNSFLDKNRFVFLNESGPTGPEPGPTGQEVGPTSPESPEGGTVDQYKNNLKKLEAKVSSLESTLEGFEQELDAMEDSESLGSVRNSLNTFSEKFYTEKRDIEGDFDEFVDELDSDLMMKIMEEFGNSEGGGDIALNVIKGRVPEKMEGEGVAAGPTARGDVQVTVEQAEGSIDEEPPDESVEVPAEAAAEDQSEELEAEQPEAPAEDQPEEDLKEDRNQSYLDALNRGLDQEDIYNEIRSQLETQFPGVSVGTPYIIDGVNRNDNSVEIGAIIPFQIEGDDRNLVTNVKVSQVYDVNPEVDRIPDLVDQHGPEMMERALEIAPSEIQRNLEAYDRYTSAEAEGAEVAEETDVKDAEILADRAARFGQRGKKRRRN
mgnify:CR=1 FL=1|jgi:hypothetical protein